MAAKKGSRLAGARAGTRTEQGITFKVEPFGAQYDAIERAALALTQNDSLRAFLGRSRSRLLAVEAVDEDRKSPRGPIAPKRFRATFYDYTEDRAVLVEGRLGAKTIQIEPVADQPLPNDEEFDAAVAILRRDRDVGSGLRERRQRAYRPMPPLIEAEGADGRVTRTLAVGLLPLKAGAAHEIVGVDLVREQVGRFAERAPASAQAHNPICGLPYAGQSTTSRGTAGSAWVNVYQGGVRIWRFLLVRPSASSGTRGSAVELRYVDYRGKRVLYRAHAPILNVLYDNNACGPYRDWQWQEGTFQANGTTPVPGIRVCSAPAQTILDSGSDTGNFKGVAIYVTGQEVVLVSELEAGWYRYISEWRLHSDGTIRPRFGFAATQNSCVCYTHHHHVYWRLDFDIRTAGNNAVREFNDPPIVGGSNWHTKSYEIRRLRDPSRKRRWLVENLGTGEGYQILPGPNDGIADAYARGDVWILRYRSSELDDGHNSTGSNTEADLDKFRSPAEYIYGRDVVIWYAAHFDHYASESSGHGHIVGPDLRPVGW